MTFSLGPTRICLPLEVGPGWPAVAGSSRDLHIQYYVLVYGAVKSPLLQLGSGILARCSLKEFRQCGKVLLAIVIEDAVVVSLWQQMQCGMPGITGIARGMRAIDHRVFFRDR